MRYGRGRGRRQVGGRSPAGGACLRDKHKDQQAGGQDRGRIAEDSTYEELLAKKGLFADLVARQHVDMLAYVKDRRGLGSMV